VGLLLNRFFHRDLFPGGVHGLERGGGDVGHHFDQVGTAAGDTDTFAHLAHEASADLQSDKVLHWRRPRGTGAERVVVGSGIDILDYQF